MRAFPDQAAGGPGRVLFRMDAGGDSCAPTLLVQSDKPPDWAALPPNYLSQPAKYKQFEPVFTVGQRLYFRLHANPTRKVGTSSKADRLAGKPRSNGRRIGLLREEDQRRWLDLKGREAGFAVLSVYIISEGLTEAHKQQAETRHTLTHAAVRFDGLLRVLDPSLFLQALHNGIGSAKGVGFGLLSVAPAGGEP